MRNRNAKPNSHPIPKRCPKCGGATIPDCSRYGERFLHGWKYLLCGVNSDSDGYYDGLKRTSITMGGRT